MNFFINVRKTAHVIDDINGENSLSNLKIIEINIEWKR